ncbi:MAG: flagellar motor protein MotB [Candidatus Pristimantibacillus sp.]
MNRKKKRDEHEEHVDESWLIPYADLLTLMLALFIVLYAVNSIDAKKFEEMGKAFSVTLNSGTGILDQSNILVNSRQIDSKSKDVSENEEKKNSEQQEQELTIRTLMNTEKDELKMMKDQIDRYIEKRKMNTMLETNLSNSQLMITISNNAIFESGEAEIKPESQKLAIAISNILQQYPEYQINVSGHTDNRPISTEEFESNWFLSSRRAIRFMDIILQNKNLNPQLFSAAGYGEYRPIASNSTPVGRAKNRRVEVSIGRKS